MSKPALLALEDGNVFWGKSIGAEGQTSGEVVFNTAMTGYQEILTDPSYCQQIITFTCPHIGNTGTNEEDEESRRIYSSGLVIRDLSIIPSNWRSKTGLAEYLQRNNVIGISEIDTRKLTKLLREKGALSGCIMAGEQISQDDAIETARAFPGLKGMDVAKQVTTSEPYEWPQGTWCIEKGLPEPHHHFEEKLPYHVVAYDYGIKHNILRMLVDRGCRITVVPAQMTAAEVFAMKPDGVFLSNGPGDPEPCDYAIEAIRIIIEQGLPVFGICLGHQLLALASGAKTTKMKFGHHGANHPVLALDNGQVMITSQNHGFAVDEASLPENIRATHRSLFDNSLQGIHCTDKPAFGFQGHPEASPGPHDAAALFDHFIGLINSTRGDSQAIDVKKSSAIA